MTIIRAKISDLDAVSQLNSLLFTYETQFSDQFNLDWTKSKIGQDYFQQRLSQPQSLVLLALDDNKIVGYLCAHISNYAFRRSNPICEIENMFVLEKDRAKGIGTGLIKECQKWAKQKTAKTIRVGTLTQNKLALDFYRQLGFQDFEVVLEIKN